MKSNSLRFRAVFSLFSIVLAGCGSNSPFKYVKVSGKIGYEDGTPIPIGGMELRFTALDAPKLEKAYPRPGVARVNEKGQFERVTSYKFGDGLIPGRHKVSIDLGNGPDIKPLVPKEYTSAATTPLVVDTADSPFTIKVPKPKAISKP